MYRRVIDIPLCLGCILFGCTLDLGKAPFFCNDGVPECPDDYVCVAKNKQRVCVAESSAWAFTKDASAIDIDAGADTDAQRDSCADNSCGVCDGTCRDSIKPDLPPDVVSPDLMPDLLPDIAPDIDPCAGVVCNAPPDDECHNSWTLRRYNNPGNCNEGKCSYGHSDEYCDNHCTFGECVEGGH